jgi:hypothetical protein
MALSKGFILLFGVLRNAILGADRATILFPESQCGELIVHSDLNPFIFEAVHEK